MHFWRNLPTVPTYCALICAAEGSYGHPKYILLDDAQMPDAHATSGWSGHPWGQSKVQQLKHTTCKQRLLHTNRPSLQIHSLLHTVCYHTCSSLYQLGIAHRFWVSWAPKPETACGPFHKMHLSRLQIWSNYSLSLSRLWIGKCWAQLVSEQNDWSDSWFSSAIKRGHSDLIIFQAWKIFYSKNYRPSQEMPVVTTLHPVATKHAEERTVMHRSPSCISSSQDTTLRFGKVQCFLFFLFFLHTDMTEIYSTLLD